MANEGDAEAPRVGLVETNKEGWTLVARGCDEIAPRRSPVRARLAPHRKAPHVAGWVFHLGDGFCENVVWSSFGQVTSRQTVLEREDARRHSRVEWYALERCEEQGGIRCRVP